MFDKTHAELVEIVISAHGDRLRLWVNVEGKCACRVYRIKELFLNNLPFDLAAVGITYGERDDGR
jgi:hypothetical protein